MNNLRTPLSSCKNLPPYFFMVHLLHRLYGVDAPEDKTAMRESKTTLRVGLCVHIRETQRCVL